MNLFSKVLKKWWNHTEKLLKPNYNIVETILKYCWNQTEIQLKPNWNTVESILQGWAANSTPGIYQWHLPVFTGLENTPQVANTGKYRQIEIFLALKNCRSL